METDIEKQESLSKDPWVPKQFLSSNRYAKDANGQIVTKRDQINMEGVYWNTTQ